MGQDFSHNNADGNSTPTSSYIYCVTAIMTLPGSGPLLQEEGSPATVSFRTYAFQRRLFLHKSRHLPSNKIEISELSSCKIDCVTRLFDWRVGYGFVLRGFLITDSISRDCLELKLEHLEGLLSCSIVFDYAHAQLKSRGGTMICLCSGNPAGQ